MKLILATAACLLLLMTNVAWGAGISITPSSGGPGTTFTISFVTPKAAAKGGYEIIGRAATSQANSNSCVAKFQFGNPKRVVAHSHVKFAFKPTASEQLCTGAWTVRVKDASTGKVVLAAGHFTLS